MAQETIGHDVGIDSQVWNTTQGIREGIELAANGTEWADCIQIVGKPTGSSLPFPPQSSYEKGGLIVQVANDDPSDYAASVSKDLTGISVRTLARKNNTRTWAMEFIMTILAGVKAMVTGIEFDGDNNGDFEPLTDQIGSSYAVQMVGGKNIGNKPLTAGFFWERGTCGWHRMFVMREDAWADLPTKSFFTILYANSNIVKHQVGPDGWIMDGRRVVRKGLPDGAGVWHEFLVLE